MINAARNADGKPHRKEATDDRRPARDTGHSCIFFAHNIHHVFQVVDRMVVMRRGAIVADDLSTETSSIQDVETVITGEHLAA